VKKRTQTTRGLGRVRRSSRKNRRKVYRPKRETGGYQGDGRMAVFSARPPPQAKLGGRARNEDAVRGDLERKEVVSTRDSPFLRRELVSFTKMGGGAQGREATIVPKKHFQPTCKGERTWRRNPLISTGEGGGVLAKSRGERRNCWSRGVYLFKAKKKPKKNPPPGKQKPQKKTSEEKRPPPKKKTPNPPQKKKDPRDPPRHGGKKTPPQRTPLPHHQLIIYLNINFTGKIPPM